MKFKKVYFGKKSLEFLPKTMDKIPSGAFITDQPEIALTHIRKHDTGSAVIISENPEQTFVDTFRHFRTVKAGGGVVINSEKEILLIYRRNYWDLPKGHLEEGETLEECAVREVTEETGISKLQIIKKAAVSYHVYVLDGENILKETHWFLMSSVDREVLMPQTEEDIQKAEWIKSEALHFYLPKMYTSLQDVLTDTQFY